MHILLQIAAYFAKKKKVSLKDGKNQERMGKERRRQRDELPDKTIKEQ